MRISILLLSAAALSGAAFSSVAMAQAQEQAGEEALSTVEVRRPLTHHWLDVSEARAVAGTYALSNGWTLQVSARRNKVYAQINDGAPVELLAQTASKFASSDGRIASVFNIGPWGEDMVMSYLPDGQLSQRIVLSSSQLASR